MERNSPQTHPRRTRTRPINELSIRGSVIRVWPVKNTSSNGKCMQFQPVLIKYRGSNGRENEAFLTLAASLVGMLHLGDEVTIRFTVQAKPRTKDDFYHVSLFAHAVYHHGDQQEYYR